MPPRPTDAELALLRILWERGPATVRAIHENLGAATAKPVGYTTVLKLLQIMFEKGLVDRDEQARSHVYSARLPRQATQSQLLSDLLDKAFAGSVPTLVLHALSDRGASPAELERIRALLQGFDEPDRP